MTQLPLITNGTAKQITYATDIRAALIRSAEAHRLVKPEALDGFVAKVAGLTTDAVAWIEALGSDQIDSQGEVNVRPLLAAIIAASK